MVISTVDPLLFIGEDFFVALISHLMTYTIILGQHQIAVSLNHKRGRPKKPLVKQINDFLSQLIRVANSRRLGGNPISRVFRRLLENKKTRQVFGINLMAAVLLTGVIVPPISAFTENSDAEITTVSPAVVQLTTEASVRVPVDTFEVSQGYHLFHPAVDLNEMVGAPVYPIMDGVVEEVAYGGFGYGNYLAVDHGDGFKSLYAHLAKIIAAEGEEVDQNAVIGTVGHSGFATGSHLHLEVYDHGRAFNPLTILPTK